MFKAYKYNVYTSMDISVRIACVGQKRETKNGIRKRIRANNFFSALNKTRTLPDDGQVLR